MGKLKVRVVDTNGVRGFIVDGTNVVMEAKKFHKFFNESGYQYYQILPGSFDYLEAVTDPDSYSYLVGSNKFHYNTLLALAKACNFPKIRITSPDRVTIVNVD